MLHPFGKEADYLTGNAQVNRSFPASCSCLFMARARQGLSIAFFSSFVPPRNLIARGSFYVHRSAISRYSLDSVLALGYQQGAGRPGVDNGDRAPGFSGLEII